MFKDLKQQIRANFDKLAQNNKLFFIEVDRDLVWEMYLLSFSEEERQGHNCSACRSFLRQYGGVVAIVDNKRVLIWDNVDAPDIFKAFVSSIKAYLNSLPISDIFVTPQAHCGVDRNYDSINDVTWEHFFFLAPPKFVSPAKDIDSIKGHYRENRNLFLRGLETLTMDSIDTVLELTAQNSLYRGAEFKFSVESFRVVKEAYDSLTTEEEKSNFAWITYSTLPNTVSLIRNSAIGTLLVDLSEGVKDLDSSVASYEAKVAPTNYKRTTALVTPRQVQEAKDKLAELGLLGSLERRFAKATDLELENILFLDSGKNLVDPFDTLAGEMASAKTIPLKELNKIEEISIDKFIEDVLPLSTGVELYLQNEHLAKMVSLVTAQDSSSPTLFKWNNLFSWSYTGGITDSIKERVKAAGGQIVGELRVSLSWENYDDLDLWLYCPDGQKIGYSTYRAPSRCVNSGQLDVDENAGSGKTRTPVENIIFNNAFKMPEGVYTVRVNQFSRRETKDSGYTVQIECRGEIAEFHKGLSPSTSGATDTVVSFTYSKEEGIKFPEGTQSKLAVKEKWGLKTNGFVKVNQIMLSPNHWGTAVGNKHYMFMLENCISDEAPIPFFNEFLNNTFVENRKTFEMLAGKFPVEASQDQLSGVGFSETLPAEVVLRVTGKFKRLLKIKF
jgi:hypothetical protein